MRWSWSAVFVCALSAPSLQVGLAHEEANAPNASVRNVLSRWEQASAGLLGVGPMEHRRLHHLHQAAHSAHEIAVLNEFRGPVSADDLAQRFDWSLLSRAGQIVIVGKPTDEVEKLFYHELTVAIDPQTDLPQTVRFARSNSAEHCEPLAVVLSPRGAEPSRFLPDPSARPLQLASRDRDQESPRRQSPVRVVEHITPLPVPRTELPPEVHRALSLWETAARQVHSLHANVKRYTYESGSHVEHRAVGEFSFSLPCTIHCTLKPAVIDPQDISHRRTTDGVAYELLPSPAEYWQYTPTQIRFSHQPGEPLFVLHRVGNDPARFQLVAHEEPRAATIRREQILPPWELLFPVSASHLAERFEIRRIENEHLMNWVFVPRRQGDIGQFREMRVLVDNATWLPKAVQLVSLRGDTEEVYVFHYTEARRQEPLGLESQLLPLKQDVPKLQPAPTGLHGLP